MAKTELGIKRQCQNCVAKFFDLNKDLKSPTNGNDIARTVACLRRGWIDVYVATSYFSDQTQSEVIDDQYRIVLVDGYRLAREINVVLASRAMTCASFLAEIDAEYESQLARRSLERFPAGLNRPVFPTHWKSDS